MPRNAILPKKTARNFHAAKVSCNKVVVTQMIFNSYETQSEKYCSVRYACYTGKIHTAGTTSAIHSSLGTSESHMIRLYESIYVEQKQF